MKLIPWRQFSKSLFKYRSIATNKSSLIDSKNQLFNEEKTRQTNDVGRIEKIEVKYVGKSDNLVLLMNKNLSTPYNVAQHISDWCVEKSALAMVNSKLWDMHRPLEEDCTLSFLTFTDVDPYNANKAFWRTCSFLLGAVVQNAFSENISVTLHSFPSPSISSGSFIHDAKISLPDWKPTLGELQCLSADFLTLCLKQLPVERLQVNEKVALEIFEDSEFKRKQIPDISQNSGGKITLYRVGSHIDISKGPMVGNTSLVGRCSITAVHKIDSNDGPLYRFQGIALPKGLLLNHFAYRIVQDRSAKLNLTQPVPGHKFEQSMLS